MKIRRLLARALSAALLLAVPGAAAAATNSIFVSAKAGRDGRNGASWNNAVKTLKAALSLAEAYGKAQGQGDVAIIYMAEGDYDCSMDGIEEVTNNARMGTAYNLTRNGQKLIIKGGFATPGAITQPHDTCANNTKKYVTRLVPKNRTVNSLFRMYQNNQALVLKGLTFGGDNWYGTPADGALFSTNGGGTGNEKYEEGAYFHMEDCVVEKYRSRLASFIFLYGGKNAKVKIHRVEVLQGGNQGPSGGGFLGSSMSAIPTNTQVDMSYVTFHNISHRGGVISTSIVGLANRGTLAENPDAHFYMDHVQINRCDGQVAIGTYGAVVLDGLGDIRITNSSFQNSTGGEGGALWISGFNSFLSENNHYYNCFAGQNGGAVFIGESVNNSSTTNIDSHTTAENPKTVTFRNDRFGSNRCGSTMAVGPGGAVKIANTRTDKPMRTLFENCDFKDNATASLEGGAVWVRSSDEVTFRNCTFCGNYARKGTGFDHDWDFTGAGENSDGGAINSKCKKITVEGCHFEHNRTSRGGGAISTQDDETIIRNSVFVDNKCQNNAPSLGFPDGGAVSKHSTGTLVVENCRFTGNKASFKGGAVSLYELNNEAFTAHFTNCHFEGNTASNGGAISNYSAAASAGGSNNRVYVRNCVFDGNTADTGDGSSDGGGAIVMLASGKVLKLDNNIFKNNHTNNSGGAVNVSQRCDLIMAGNVFSANKADEDGGGVYYNAGSYPNVAVKSHNDTFHANSAGGKAGRNADGSTNAGYGGGWFLQVGKTLGGGVTYPNTDEPVAISGAKFVLNKAYGANNNFTIPDNRYAGGGLYVKNSSAHTSDKLNVDSLHNTVFYGNSIRWSDNVYYSDKRGADIAMFDYLSDVNAMGSTFQLADNTNNYPTDRFHKVGTANTFSAASNPLPADYDPQPSAGQGVDATLLVRIACVDVTEAEEQDVTAPHAEVTTSLEDPTHYAVYCHADKAQAWVKLQSVGGEGPYRFYYDVYRQPKTGGTPQKLNTDPLVATTPLTKQVERFVEYEYDEVVTGGDTTYVVKDSTVFERMAYVDYVQIPSAVEAYNPQVGDLFTFVVTEIDLPKVKMVDGQAVIDDTIDPESFNLLCGDDYSVTRSYAQDAGAQIFLDDCQGVDKADLDWDDDGITNLEECGDLTPANLEPNKALPAKNANWSVPFVSGRTASQLFVDIVGNTNYLAAQPTTGQKVLTLLPSVIQAAIDRHNASAEEADKKPSLGTDGNFEDVDLSYLFGYDRPGAVVVSAYGYNSSEGKFITHGTQTGNLKHTRWLVKGTAHPYVLMQSTPNNTFNANQEFAIQLFDKKDPMSQTLLYTDTASTSSYHDKFTLLESNTYKKVIFHNDNINLSGVVALSYLNTDPGKKMFEFAQTDPQGSVVTAVTLIIPCDEDMDGTPNAFDLDSDGDGCIDVLESVKAGGGRFIEADLDGDKLAGEVAANGIPTAAGTGSSKGESQDATKNSQCNYWVGGVSTDFNDSANWSGNQVPPTNSARDLVFATEKNNPKGGPAVRDMVIGELPGGSTTAYMYNKLVMTDVPNEKYHDDNFDGQDDAADKAPGYPGVVIVPGGNLKVSTVEGADKAEMVSRIYLRADSTGAKATAGLVLSDACGQSIYGTVEYHPLGSYHPGRTTVDSKDSHSPEFNQSGPDEYDWQFIGIPVESIDKSPTFAGMVVRQWQEPLNDASFFYRKWATIRKGTNLEAFKGYEVAPVTAGKIAKIAGKLNTCAMEVPLTRRAAEVTAAKFTDQELQADQWAKHYGLGNNLVANSYTSGIAVKDIDFNPAGKNAEDLIEPAVYLYTTGAWSHWRDKGDASGATEAERAKGSYEQITQATAGSGLNAKVIPAMQAFMVKYKAPVQYDQTAVEYIKLPLPLLGGSPVRNGRMRAKAWTDGEGDEPLGFVYAELGDGTTFDKLTLFEHSGADDAFEYGWDGQKMEMGAPAVFATTSDGKAVGTDVRSSLSVRFFSVEVEKGKDYQLRLKSGDTYMPYLRLVDTETGIVTKFNGGEAVYDFKAFTGGIHQDRFLIVDSYEKDFDAIMALVGRGTATGVLGVETAPIDGTAEVYTLSGAKVGTYSLPIAKGVLPAGVYMLNTSEGASKVVVE